ncbi:phthiotriol/phenolphthiotriol dimycocerosates methyltransferase [Mycolicibacterium confluentis]|uniref:Phthiotriol/phenolphthiotriol dimycocerosates methyltransferase n=1 Tax=Mycolicibacterium confluentis TaxID=28047 RepID=A0A7I7Y3Q4_9MYCO|nr:class I SAM-dependent methyltransferase [Mycolicibacterium confluentis]BBZ36297.1 phthiotriol/phenolphthiotriol dimycocerosates methyltransferase [Mycolicibacterium confluentis]
MQTEEQRSISSVVKSLAQKWYPYVTRTAGDDLLFINAGYEETPPMSLPLEPEDEPDRYFIQLYHQTATQVDLTGKRLLEISCGHGGGASYIVRTLGTASVTGLDLNPVGIEFCRRKHQLPGLDFIHGDAVDLPFADNTFDAVLNIQASFAYPSLARFMSEVHRVLRPGGHLLYTDRRKSRQVPEWETALIAGPLRRVSDRIISEEVATGLERNMPRMTELTRYPAFIARRQYANTARQLRRGDICYRMSTYVRD